MTKVAKVINKGAEKAKSAGSKSELFYLKTLLKWLDTLDSEGGIISLPSASDFARLNASLKEAAKNASDKIKGVIDKTVNILAKDEKGAIPTKEMKRYRSEVLNFSKENDKIIQAVHAKTVFGIKRSDLRTTLKNVVNGLIVEKVAKSIIDYFHQSHRVILIKKSKKNNLEHFIYTNSLIDTSRDFCIHRAGKAFTMKETEDWVNDPELPISDKWKATYNPLLHMGGFNCRHFPKFITKETYDRIK